MNLITLAWLLASLFGLVFWIINLRVALDDQKAARLIVNFRREARMIVVNGAVFRNRIRVAVFAWWSLLGIAFGFFKLPQILGLAGVLGLIATVLGLSVTGYQEARERRRLDAILRTEMRRAGK